MLIGEKGTLEEFSGAISPNQCKNGHAKWNVEFGGASDIEREDRFQRAIDPPSVQLILVFEPRFENMYQLACGPDRNEKQEIEIERLERLEPGCLQLAN